MNKPPTAKPRFSRHAALSVAQEILTILLPVCERIIIAGSLRREKQWVGDVEILYISREMTGNTLGDFFAQETRRLAEDRINHTASTSCPCVPDCQNDPSPARQSNQLQKMYTKPPLSRRLTNLLRPLSKEGREIYPGYYLVALRPKIAKSPLGSSIAERTSRSVEVAAIYLWWPIARVLTAAHLVIRKPDIRRNLAWWTAIDAAQSNHRLVQAPMSSSEPSLGRTEAHAAAILEIQDSSSSLLSNAEL